MRGLGGLARGHYVMVGAFVDRDRGCVAWFLSVGAVLGLRRCGSLFEVGDGEAGGCFVFFGDGGYDVWGG